MRHPDALIAKIRGAYAAGIPAKTIAHLSNVSVNTIYNYTRNADRPYVTPDTRITGILKEWFENR